MLFFFFSLLWLVLPPISTVGITSSSEDITALVEKTRGQMLEAIEELGRRRIETNRLLAVFREGQQSPPTLTSS